MSQPIFTIVIPTYNRAQVIGAALQSVFEQTFSDFEIVVVDDGSADDLEGALKPFDDPRLRVVRQANGGGSRARNRGIDAARGTYIAFLDSDDRFLPHHLHAMHQIVGQCDDVIAYAQVVVMREGGKTFLKPPRPLRDGESMAEYLCCDRGFVQTSTLVVPTRLARKVHYRDGMKFGQDTDFAIRLSLEPCRFVMAPEPGAIWTDTASGSRVSANRKGASNLRWIEQIKPRIPARAYHGYRGWHIAKGVATKSRWQASNLYLTAVAHGCYSFKLAIVVWCQIFMPDPAYRTIANLTLGLGRTLPMPKKS